MNKKKEKVQKKPKQAKNKKIKEPQYLPSCINNLMINYKVYYMNAGEKIFYFFLIFLIGGFVGEIFYGGLFKEDGEATMATYISGVIVFCLIGFIAVIVFTPQLIKMMQEKRQQKLKMQFRNLLEILTTSLSSGNTVTDSFRNAGKDLLNQYSEKDYIVCEVNEIIHGLNNGVTLELLIKNFGDRSGIEDITNFSNVIGNCYRMGGDFKEIVRKTKDIISDSMAIQDEIETKLASNKLQLNAMMLMPVLLVAMMKKMNSSFADNLTSPLGIIITTISLGMFAGAYFWGRTIVKIEG